MKTLKIALMSPILLTSTIVWGQANVNESAEKAYVYVDVKNGSDSNPGTQQRPFQTITKGAHAAITNNRAGTGTRVTILPGTYRESFVYWGGPNNTSAPITLEAATAGTVTVSGADVWRDWKEDENNAEIFTHSWPYQWGYCPQLVNTEEGIVRRREMIFVNGESLTQVLARRQMMAGTFYVDEGASTVYLWPPSGTAMDSATIEVAVRPTLLQIEGMKNMAVRGINFQYSNGCRQSQPAVIFAGESSNILVDDDTFSWNNNIGLSMSGVNHVTVQNSVANHNGETGFIGRIAKNSVWDSDEGSYNDWRGAQGAYYGVESGGAKFMGIHNSTVTNFKAAFNVGVGVHWDTDNVNIVADSLQVFNNFWSAASVEATQGPVTVSNSVMCNNNPQNWPYSGGIELVDASNVTMTGNTFFQNGTSSVIVLGRPGGISVTNYETGETFQVHNQNASLTNNVLAGQASQQVFHDGFTGADWDLFSNTLSSDNNVWWNPSTGYAFAVGVPKSNTMVDLPGWRNATGQDPHSRFSQPAGEVAESCSVSPDAPDFWFVTGPSSNTATTTRGDSASYTVSVVPVGFSGSVSLRSDFQIPGARASFSTRSINTSGSSTFTINTSSATPSGRYSVVMIAASGSLVRTITVPLIVQ